MRCEAIWTANRFKSESQQQQQKETRRLRPIKIYTKTKNEMLIIAVLTYPLLNITLLSFWPRFWKYKSARNQSQCALNQPIVSSTALKERNKIGSVLSAWNTCEGHRVTGCETRWWHKPLVQIGVGPLQGSFGWESWGVGESVSWSNIVSSSSAETGTDWVSL